MECGSDCGEAVLNQLLGRCRGIEYRIFIQWDENSLHHEVPLV
jgi:hypothetical protein